MTQTRPQCIIQYLENFQKSKKEGMFLDKKIATRNFRLFLTGQAISFIGSWLQNVALAWVVLEITNSAFWVGFVSGLPLLTSALLVCAGGILADKFEKRKIIYFTQAVQIIQAFLLGCLVIWKIVNLPLIFSLAVVQGVALAVERPTRMAFIPEIVGTCRIKQTIAMSTAFGQVAKVVGPSAAGLLIAVFGTSWVFFINGFSFLAVVGTLPLLTIIRSRKMPHGNAIELFLSGAKYALSDSKIRMYILLAGLIAISGFAYRAILPSIAVDVFQAGPELLGLLFASAGLGSAVGALLVYRQELSPCLISLGCLTAGIALVIFSAAAPDAHGMAFGLLFLAGSGFAISSLTAKIMTQLVAKKEMLGRVSGLMIASTNGGTAFGQFAMGGIASLFGCVTAILINGLFLILLAGFAFYAKRKGNH